MARIKELFSYYYLTPLINKITLLTNKFKNLR